MTYRGKIKNGVVVLERKARFPEGMSVSVSPLKSGVAAPKKRKRKLTHYELMKPFIGAFDDLPSDLSVNHDHYLYGAPKRK